MEGHYLRSRGTSTRLIAALMRHHGFNHARCLNLRPIGVAELARSAGVPLRTAYNFFSHRFLGYKDYKRLCTDGLELTKVLRKLSSSVQQRGGFRPVGGELSTLEHNQGKREAAAGDASQHDPLAGLRPACRKAWASYKYAEAKAGRRLEEYEAYYWLKKNWINKNEPGGEELVGYILPSFEAWGAYIRQVRRLLDEQKRVQAMRAARNGYAFQPQIGELVETGTESSDDAPALLDVGDVAKMLGCSRGLVYRLAGCGAMPQPVKIGRLFRWRRATGDPTTGLEDWLRAGCPPCKKEGR